MRSTQSYLAYLEFRKAIEKGKSTIYLGKDFVVVPMKKYRELTEKFK